MIDAEDLTLRYPSGKGIFDLNFKVKEGEVVGYLGPNGAGKTTTIRVLLGFMKPMKGKAEINSLDCWRKAPRIMKTLGYIPGEIAFMDGMSGDEFLKYLSDVRGIKDTSFQKHLFDMFEFSPKGKIKKFSKGMKQKLGIIAAFMHNPDVLILDEPTSGLDPLMQNRFVELILSEKEKGKTILMSSHMFEEVERTCDKVLIIKEGKIVKQSDVATLKSSQRKGFVLISADNNAVSKALKDKGFELGTEARDTVEVFVSGNNMDLFLRTIVPFNVKSLDVKAQTLEDVFMHFYGKEVK